MLSNAELIMGWVEQEQLVGDLFSALRCILRLAASCERVLAHHSRSLWLLTGNMCVHVIPGRGQNPCDAERKDSGARHPPRLACSQRDLPCTREPPVAV